MLCGKSQLRRTCIRLGDGSIVAIITDVIHHIAGWIPYPSSCHGVRNEGYPSTIVSLAEEDSNFRWTLNIAGLRNCQTVLCHIMRYPATTSMRVCRSKTIHVLAHVNGNVETILARGTSRFAVYLLYPNRSACYSTTSHALVTYCAWLPRML